MKKEDLKRFMLIMSCREHVTIPEMRKILWNKETGQYETEKVRRLMKDLIYVGLVKKIKLPPRKKFENRVTDYAYEWIWERKK